MPRPGWGGSRTVLASLAVAILGCEALAGIGERYLTGSSDASTVCAHHRPPARPDAAPISGDASSDAGAPDPLILAVTHTDVGVAVDDAGRPVYESLGFDLDDACGGPTCASPSWATPGPVTEVDGIDNAYGRSGFERPSTASGSDPELLLRIRGYSGEPDDPQVEVCVYVAYGLDPRVAGDGGAAPDGGSPADGGDPFAAPGPLWDGHDRWQILREVVNDAESTGDHPKYCDLNAYVTSGTLVARLPEARWPAPQTVLPAWLLPVRDLTISGRISRVDGGGVWQLEDAIVGLHSRLSDDLIWIALVIPPLESLANLPYCHNPPGYRVLKRNLCSFADIASRPGPCDSLSAGLRMQALQAEFGAISPLASPPAPYSSCDPAVNFGTDTCDSLAANDQ